MSAHGRSEAWGDGAQRLGGKMSAHGRSEAVIPLGGTARSAKGAR
jgi:hypothetical protein